MNPTYRELMRAIVLHHLAHERPWARQLRRRALAWGRR